MSHVKDLAVKLRIFNTLKMVKCKIRTFKDPYKPCKATFFLKIALQTIHHIYHI